MIKAYGRLVARNYERKARLWREHPYRMVSLTMMVVLHRVLVREYGKNPEFRAQVDERIEAIRVQLNKVVVIPIA